MQAIRDVHLGHLFGNLGLFEVAFLAFGTAAGVFGLGLLVLRRHQIGLLAANRGGVLAVNITTTLAWISSFGALRLAEPAAVNLAFSGVAPIAVAALGMFGLATIGERIPSRSERLLHWALLAIVVLLGIVVSAGFSGVPQVDPIAGLGGIALAAFAGVAITAESIYAKRMNVTGVSPLAIVGARFLMVTCVAGLMVAQSHAPYNGLRFDGIARHALIFLGIVVGPIYLAQAGLALTSPLMSSVLLSIGPIVTLVLQSTAGGLRIAPAMLAVTSAYALASIIASILSARAGSQTVD
jgi:drug/metabolite transporter (DMT)-like permease